MKRGMFVCFTFSLVYSGISTISDDSALRLRPTARLITLEVSFLSLKLQAMDAKLS